MREFTWDDLADWYLEVCKFEKNEEKGFILVFVLETLLKLWHPFVPFVTEAVWSVIHPGGLLMAEKWPASISLSREAECSDFEVIKEAITAIRNARSEHKIEPSRKIKAMIIAGKMAGFLKSQEILIKGLRTGIFEIEIREAGSPPEDAIYVSRAGVEIYLSGAVERQAEKARLEKELEGFEKGVKVARSKLDDQEFTSKAPEHIVQGARENLLRLESEIDRIKSKIASL